jgi:osmotically-inducible protein OsmY
MFPYRGAWRSSWGALAIVAGVAGLALGQQAVPPRAADNPQFRPEVIMTRALRSNPLTAPYAIGAIWQDGTVILAGRVGTKQVHDAAVQMAIAFGFKFRDDLVIDTAETMRVAMSATPSMTGYGMLAPNVSSSYYVYPQPLFGWLDDPFFGMQPPVVSFAPWWRPRRDVPMVGPAGARPMVPPTAAGAVGAQAYPNAPPATPVGAQGFAPSPMVGGQTAPPGAAGAMELPPAKGDIEITVDANGQVFLRGVVASQEVAREIEQTAWSVPGVSRVITQFQVKPRHSGAVAHDEPPPSPQPIPGQVDSGMVPPRRDPAAAGIEFDRTPAPPQPAPPAPPGPDPVPQAPAAGRAPQADAGPAPLAVSALDPHRLTRRVVDALTRRPALRSQEIKVGTTGDAVTLAGKVATAYEAMLAFRAAQQTPGVRDVIDGLEFVVPDEDHPNPLVRKGRPEDIEPYVTAQMSRHLGDIAHIDSVKARGDHLEIRGTLLNAADKDRVLAILRSIPVLHGFQLDSTLTAD